MEGRKSADNILNPWSKRRLERETARERRKRAHREQVPRTDRPTTVVTTASTTTIVAATAIASKLERERETASDCDCVSGRVRERERSSGQVRPAERTDLSVELKNAGRRRRRDGGNRVTAVLVLLPLSLAVFSYPFLRLNSTRSVLSVRVSAVLCIVEQ